MADGGLDQHHALVCEPISGPKSNGGSPVCSVVMVDVGGCCGLLSPFDVLFVLIWALPVGVGLLAS
jgi:hypothetical protein